MDTQAHRQAAADAYSKVRHVYERFAVTVKSILHSSIPKEYAIHSIEARAKDVESFAKKACKVGDSTDAFKYTEPMTQIMDMAGVRVITFFPRTVDEVCRIVPDQFTATARTAKCRL